MSIGIGWCRFQSHLVQEKGERYGRRRIAGANPTRMRAYPRNSSSARFHISSSKAAKCAGVRAAMSAASATGSRAERAATVAGAGGAGGAAGATGATAIGAGVGGARGAAEDFGGDGVCLGNDSGVTRGQPGCVLCAWKRALLRSLRSTCPKAQSPAPMEHGGGL